MKKILLVTLMLMPGVLGAATLPKKIDGYIPADRYVAGANVKVNFGDDFAEAIKPIQEAVNTLAKNEPEVLQAIQKESGNKGDEPIPNDERLKIAKADYDKYIAAWNNRKLVPVERVQLRLEENSDKKWKINAFSVGQNGMAPLPLHVLVYDEKEDIWTTPNGKLVRKEEVKFGKNNLFGEWSGPQWVFEEKNSFGTVIENFAMGKSQTSGDVFLVYRLMEVTPASQVVAQNMYVIRVEAKDLKLDPLREAAKEKAAQSKAKK